MISLIIPSYNNLKHLKNVYASIRKNAPTAKILFLDDGSTDGTWEWLMSLPKDNLYQPYRSDIRVGHTILYDKGISLVDSDIIGILHADMIVGPNYIENLIKHLKPGTVVCATRIEPPLHPEGPEKIIMDFGLDFDNLRIDKFEQFCIVMQGAHYNETTNGMFAPWIMYKSDFEAIGGHDHNFAPFPYEDSDIFQRWLLAGYKLVQSRDAFVYHLTCRGHRWTDKIGVNDNYFIEAEKKARKYYIQKWGSWIKNDSNQHPILIPVYKKCSIILNYKPTPYDEWFGDINPDSDIDKYSIVNSFDLERFNQDDLNVLVNLNEIVKEVGTFEASNIIINVNNLTDISSNLIKK